jgi:hypothetical protein
LFHFVIFVEHKQKTNAMTNEQKNQHADFKVAKQIALTMNKGCYRRKGNYLGYKDYQGRMWVIGDTMSDLQNPDATILGCPAREIYGDFTMMKG